MPFWGVIVYLVDHRVNLGISSLREFCVSSEGDIGDLGNSRFLVPTFVA
jgi:hypothetical protein